VDAASSEEQPVNRETTRRSAKSSAKNFFIFKFVLSFFGRTVYNMCACLGFWIGVGNASV
jgi:hypothetical protein